MYAVIRSPTCGTEPQLEASRLPEVPSRTVWYALVEEEHSVAFAGEPTSRARVAAKPAIDAQFVAHWFLGTTCTIHHTTACTTPTIHTTTTTPTVTLQKLILGSLVSPWNDVYGVHGMM